MTSASNSGELFEGEVIAAEDCGEHVAVSRGEDFDESLLVRGVVGECGIDQRETCFGEADHDHSAVTVAPLAADQASPFENVEAMGDGTRRHHHRLDELTSCQLKRRAVAAKRGQDIELPRFKTVFGEDLIQTGAKCSLDSTESADDCHARHIDIWTFAAPLFEDQVHPIGSHLGRLS
jgi:hypothetical protein